MNQNMKIAVACDGLTVAPAFVQTSSYMCYTVENGTAVDCHNIPAMDQPLEKLPEFFRAIGVTMLVSGKIDPDVATNLIENGIDVLADNIGDPLTIVRAFLRNH